MIVIELGRNVSFAELSEIKNTLSNQDFLVGWIKLISWRTCSACRSFQEVESVQF